MTGKRGVIALQVLLSGVALLVVYITLLTPNNEGPLRGIQAPGHGGKHEDAETKERGRGAKPRSRPRANVGRVPSLPRPTSPPGPAALLDETTAPTQAQYGDSLAQIRARVASGR